MAFKKIKGQAFTPEMVMGVLVLGVLLTVAILVLGSTIDAVPQDKEYVNESLCVKASYWTTNDTLCSVVNPPFYPDTVTVFNNSGGEALAVNADYLVNSTTQVYLWDNATGNNSQTVLVTYTHQEFNKEAQLVITETNSNWSNGFTLLGIALIVLAAGAIIYTTRTFGGGE